MVLAIAGKSFVTVEYNKQGSSDCLLSVTTMKRRHGPWVLKDKSQTDYRFGQLNVTTEKITVIG